MKMKTLANVLRFVLLDIVRRKVVFAYMAFLFLISSSLFYFSPDGEKAVIGMMNVLLLVVPLMCVVFGTTYLYHAREFIVLLLAQPVSRRVIFAGQFTGLASSLCLALVAGAGLPMLVFGGGTGSGRLLIVALLLTLAFTAIALLIALRNDDKARGTGIALLTWFYFTFLFDGILLLVILYFSDYPVEPLVIALSMLNPVDAGRIMLSMSFHVSAMMGYTGAVVAEWFGSRAGYGLLPLVLAGWCIVPVLLAARRFARKDF